MKLPGITYVPGHYPIGGIISVPVATEVGLVSHKGVMSDGVGPDGLPTVIHNAKLFGYIVESSMTEFCLRAQGPVCAEGYPSVLSPEDVLARARSQMGQPWRVWFNCEHFARWAHDQPVESPQLRRKAKSGAMVLTGFLTGCFLLASRGG